MAASLYDIPFETIGGEPASLAAFKGKVLLIVNVASKCGLTPQYEALEKIYELYCGRGFVIAGFPANDFKQQEPGSNSEIQTFCSTNYNIQFPIFSKVTVIGEGKHPLYSALIAAKPQATSFSTTPFREKLKGYGIDILPEPEILWNFEKFLIGRDGAVVARFSPDTAPDAPEIVAAIEAELANS